MIFEGFIFKSEPADDGENWTIVSSDTDNYDGITIEKSTDGEWRLHMNSASYAKAEKSIEDTGMYEIPVKYQQGEEQEKQLKRI